MLSLLSEIHQSDIVFTLKSSIIDNLYLACKYFLDNFYLYISKDHQYFCIIYILRISEKYRSKWIKLNYRGKYVVSNIKNKNIYSFYYIYLFYKI